MKGAALGESTRTAGDDEKVMALENTRHPHRISERNTKRATSRSIVDRLREEIVLGKFSEGEPLRETPLAKRFDVSRGPIRDAILQLVSEGLVEDRPNRGARVGRVWDESTRPAMVKVRQDIETLALRQ